jgi:outer membrane immunogenic protein
MSGLSRNRSFRSFFGPSPIQITNSRGCVILDTAFPEESGRIAPKIKTASGELNMKKIVLALAALGALTTAAAAADLGAKPYVKAPPPAPPPYSWTGFYIFGGGGGGLWAADQNVVVTATGLPLTQDQRHGGSGWFGTVGAGYDWQFNTNWVFGIFGDGQFGSIRGTIVDPIFPPIQGTLKLQDSWAAGVRLGWLVAPNVLSYVNAGYSGAHFSGTTLVDSFAGVPFGLHTDSFNRNGWFVGGGYESNLDIFGINYPGLFWKTEYRSAFYGRKTVDELIDGTNVPVGTSIRMNNWNQTISTSLVYRFNWTGSAVPRY